MSAQFSIARAIVEAAQILRQAGVPEARREAASLLEHLIGCDRTFLITHAETALASSDVRRLRDLVERRAAGEPLQYITGHQEFYGLDFEVTSDVLIPRPETELLVETALKFLDETSQPARICDVGTGTGCIPIAILHERPSVQAVGLDISYPALRIAARNAARHDVHERLSLVASDCLAALDTQRARFHMIVSNPPYVAEDALPGLQREVRDHEPRVALTPGGDGLSIIRRLIEDAPHFLETNGHLLMEIGFDQHEAVGNLIDSQAWELLDIHKDLQGIPRTLALRKN
ncbi:MAG: release factor glutamine methyltransferase [Acidobacteriota bacterium]|jgi:release factor glutamine methyltransferase|nr:release factor glutamine methyltransferase [Acidobacteriota bacterium]